MSAEECIHGLGPAMCDVCSPMAAVAGTVSPPLRGTTRAARATTRRVPADRASTTRRSSQGARQVRGGSAAAPNSRLGSRASETNRFDDVGSQRIYHLTHLRNLEAILLSGSLLADTSLQSRVIGTLDASESLDVPASLDSPVSEERATGGRPIVDISTDDTRQTRRHADVPGRIDSTVADHVPFFLTPESSMWNAIRAREVDDRLSIDPAATAPADFVMLITTVKTVAEAHSAEEAIDHVAPDQDAMTQTAKVGERRGYSLADCDAALPATRFATTAVDVEQLLRRIRHDHDVDSDRDDQVVRSSAPGMTTAEFLVAHAVPFEQISLIGVANDRARDQVKAMLEPSGFRPRVSVYPPWFQPQP